MTSIVRRLATAGMIAVPLVIVGCVPVLCSPRAPRTVVTSDGDSLEILNVRRDVGLNRAFEGGVAKQALVVQVLVPSVHPETVSTRIPGMLDLASQVRVPPGDSILILQFTEPILSRYLPFVRHRMRMYRASEDGEWTPRKSASSRR